MIISILGIHGSRTAAAKQDNDECNLALWIYAVLTFIIFVSFAGIVFLGVNQMGGMGDMEVKELDEGVAEVEAEIKTRLLDNSGLWVELQDFNECCGFDDDPGNDNFRTGNVCADSTQR